MILEDGDVVCMHANSTGAEAIGLVVPRTDLNNNFYCNIQGDHSDSPGYLWRGLCRDRLTGHVSSDRVVEYLI